MHILELGEIAVLAVKRYCNIHCHDVHCHDKDKLVKCTLRITATSILIALFPFHKLYMVWE